MVKQKIVKYHVYSVDTESEIPKISLKTYDINYKTVIKQVYLGQTVYLNHDPSMYPISEDNIFEIKAIKKK